jgi:hypothetical protein
MALGTSGCLITDKSSLSAPTATPPFVNNLDPPATQILDIPRKPGTDKGSRDYVETQNIWFDIRSDDMQRFLFAVVLVDYPSSDPERPASPVLWRFAPDIGTLDTPRRRTCPLIIPAYIDPGCHSITAVVSHDESIQKGIVKPTPPGAVPDIGTSTWWAQIGHDISDPEYPDPCEPNPPKSPDAGADGRMDGVGP